jgi:LysR family transcriptional regulator, glycine cleavage system transcriptional activator
MRKTHVDTIMMHLPPLNSLKSFESAARNESFTLAATELSVSQGAISKQIKNLEEYLATPLFERKYQKVILTEKGEKYIKQISAALCIIDKATFELTKIEKSQEQLRVNIIPTLATKWLIPRLNKFHDNNSLINVTIETGDGPIDLKNENVDIFIRAHKSPPQKDILVMKIMEEDLIPVCAPTLKVSTPNDLVEHTLLKHTTRPNMWHEYLTEFGFSELKIDHQLGFEHFFMLIQAAIDGLGVALIPRIFILEEMAQGKLTQVFDFKINDPVGYYLYCKDTISKQKKSVHF